MPHLSTESPRCFQVRGAVPAPLPLVAPLPDAAVFFTAGPGALRLPVTEVVPSCRGRSGTSGAALEGTHPAPEYPFVTERPP
ncbi:hypothetical protein GCM10027270_24330 [Nocardioides ginkgobilobae]